MVKTRVGQRRRADTAALRALSFGRAVSADKNTETGMTFNRRQFTQAGACLVDRGATPLAFAADTLKIGYVRRRRPAELAPLRRGRQMGHRPDEGRLQGRHQRSAAASMRVQIVLKDSQSNPHPRGRGRERPDPLGQGGCCVLTAGTPETAEPASQRCHAELNEGALASRAWCRGSRGSSAARAIRPRASTGPITCSGALEDVIANLHQRLEDGSPTNKKVGGAVFERRRRQRLGRQGAGPFPKLLAQTGL